MPNRRQFVRHTAAFGLSVGLLPGSAALQNRSTRGAHATFFVGGANDSDVNPGTASAPFGTIQAAVPLLQATES
jgi:uncharacterized protein (DUF1501 family)